MNETENLKLEFDQAPRRSGQRRGGLQSNRYSSFLSTLLLLENLWTVIYAAAVTTAVCATPDGRPYTAAFRSLGKCYRHFFQKPVKSTQKSPKKLQ